MTSPSTEVLPAQPRHQRVRMAQVMALGGIHAQPWGVRGWELHCPNREPWQGMAPSPSTHKMSGGHF